MEIFNIITKKYESKDNFNMIAYSIHKENSGIIYAYTGCATKEIIIKAIEEKLIKLSDELKINLTTQICINVSKNKDDYLRGFTIIYIQNCISYCLLVGLDKGGQSIIKKDVEKEIISKSLALLNQKYQGIKPQFTNYKQLQKCKDNDVHESFSNFYHNIMINTNNRYEELKLKYVYNSQDINKLGFDERKKKQIIDNLGTITLKIPFDTQLEDDKIFNRCLHIKLGTNQLSQEFLNGLFKPFNPLIIMCKNESLIILKDNKQCFLLSSLYKVVNVAEMDNLIFNKCKEFQYNHIINLVEGLNY